jgi:uncharacterized protein (DUF488 family)
MIIDMTKISKKSRSGVNLLEKLAENRVSVNTKNWHRKETDLWVEFDRRAPFGKKLSSKYSVKTSAVGSASSFGRRAVSRLEEEAFGKT